MIKNIIFDFGNVLVRFRPETQLRRFTRSDEEADALRRLIYLSKPWKDTDRGLLTRQECIDALCKMHPDKERRLRPVFPFKHEHFGLRLNVLAVSRHSADARHRLASRTRHQARSRHIQADSGAIPAGSVAVSVYRRYGRKHRLGGRLRLPGTHAQGRGGYADRRAHAYPGNRKQTEGGLK